MLGNKLLNIQFAKYHIWNNKSEGFPNMVLSTETFNQSVRTEYSEAVNARYTFQPLWVSDTIHSVINSSLKGTLILKRGLIFVKAWKSTTSVYIPNKIAESLHQCLTYASLLN